MNPIAFFLRFCLMVFCSIVLLFSVIITICLVFSIVVMLVMFIVSPFISATIPPDALPTLLYSVGGFVVTVGVGVACFTYIEWMMVNIHK